MFDLLHTLSSKNIVTMMVNNNVSEKDTIRLKAYRFNNYMERVKQS